LFVCLFAYLLVCLFASAQNEAQRGALRGVALEEVVDELP
jgi:hypothetical protein